jgi:hypothetical protein
MISVRNNRVLTDPKAIASSSHDVLISDSISFEINNFNLFDLIFETAAQKSRDSL